MAKPTKPTIKRTQDKRLSAAERVATDKARFLEALRNNRGLLSYARKATGLSTSFFNDCMRIDPDFAAEYLEIQEEQIDKAENKLYDHIDGDDVTSNIFYLKCKGKKRGYVERQEVRLGGDTEVPLVDSTLVANLVMQAMAADKANLDKEPT